jgi:hypothetical protein
MRDKGRNVTLNKRRCSQANRQPPWFSQTALLCYTQPACCEGSVECPGRRVAVKDHLPFRRQVSLLAMFSVALLLVPAAWLQAPGLRWDARAAGPGAAYAVQKVIAGGATEYRFLYGAHHFMTLVDEGGTFNLRPHPGLDPNGWGSSWYAQPFLPGATLGHTAIETPAATADGIRIVASGQVSRGPSGSYGTWQAALLVSYDPSAKEVRGEGEYGPLSAETGDLNLFKIASNYLDDVPLLAGGIGDAGDMRQAVVAGDAGFGFNWLPPGQPEHFPADASGSLSVDVLGRFNLVDTEAMGYAPIKPAIKPSLQVALASRAPVAPITFGAIYDLAHRQDFWEDNVGITPLIRAPSARTAYRFDVQFFSRAEEHFLYAPLTFR